MGWWKYANKERCYYTIILWWWQGEVTEIQTIKSPSLGKRTRKQTSKDWINQPITIYTVKLPPKVFRPFFSAYCVSQWKISLTFRNSCLEEIEKLFLCTTYRLYLLHWAAQQVPQREVCGLKQLGLYSLKVKQPQTNGFTHFLIGKKKYFKATKSYEGSEHSLCT